MAAKRDRERVLIMKTPPKWGGMDAAQAEVWAKKQGWRLPTEGELRRLFESAPWYSPVYEWTSTLLDPEKPEQGNAVIGGAWFAGKLKRDRAGRLPALLPIRDRDALGVGFRCVQEVADDRPCPEGWVELAPPREGEGR